ncbi:MAG: SPFH/Band 7/PHB domain protein [Clostridia bacterium]|nr:SPFH/Band 7/PHB domain protein [Clostridia bacterium]
MTNAILLSILPSFGPALILLVFLILLIAFLASNIVIVPQASAFIIERLGAYQTTWDTGLHFKLPLVERVANKVTLKERVSDFPPQPVITKDNVTMQIDTVIYFQVTDPKLFTYGVVHPMAAIETLTATTLRNIIGDLELDQTLTSRDIINTKMRTILDEATDPWGIKINRVELKNIIPPREIQDAMERQMKAERERRESILKAEGEKRSQILIAEGEKEAVILRAEAVRQQKIKEAEGEAEALLAIQTALANSIKLLNEAAPGDNVIKLKALEAFKEAANGKATKIIIPSEIQGLAGLAASAKELFTAETPASPEE